MLIMKWLRLMTKYDTEMFYKIITCHKLEAGIYVIF